MIDYDKLKEAHELCNEVLKANNVNVTLESNYIALSNEYIQGYDVREDYYIYQNGEDEFFETIDEVIERLKELKKPAPKNYEELKETGAEKIHDAYIRACEMLGFEVREENKVCYSELSEASKDLDRASFCSAINTLHEFGLINEDKLNELTQSDTKNKER